jgi:hypothetical protein
MSDATRIPPNKTAEYWGRGLRCERSWTTDYASYGLVVFKKDGQVLLGIQPTISATIGLRSPRGGRSGRTPARHGTARPLEEPGHKPDIIGHIQKTFIGGSMNSANNFYLGFDTRG